MRNIISFMHISLDGFVAGPKGEMDWIKIDPEIFEHVGKRISQGDTALYGRVTYDLMESYWPTAADKPGATTHDKEHSKWYAQAHKLVISKTLKGIQLPNTTILSENLEQHIQEKKQSGTGEILMFGSPGATHELLRQNLIDGYWLFVNPVILGKGIPLFQNIKLQTKLNLQTTKLFSSGVVELSYLVDK